MRGSASGAPRVAKEQRRSRARRVRLTVGIRGCEWRRSRQATVCIHAHGAPRRASVNTDPRYCLWPSKNRYRAVVLDEDQPQSPRGRALDDRVVAEALVSFEDAPEPKAIARESALSVVARQPPQRERNRAPGVHRCSGLDRD